MQVAKTGNRIMGAIWLGNSVYHHVCTDWKRKKRRGADD
uniref:Uncharacterized protein n=1 Tax=Arundo donax TaxID=35708 RepID=A0A0A9CEW5_ARUDO